MKTLSRGYKGKEVKLWQEFLNIESDGVFNKLTEESTKEFQLKNGLKADGIAGSETIAKAVSLGFEIPEKKCIELTAEQLIYIMKGCKESSILKYIEPINMAIKKYEIDTYLRVCHFLAQVGHESGSLRFSHELASGRMYEGRKDLGNIYPGDGMKYKGQGLIQLTGRLNITSFGKYTGIDFTKENPARIGDEPELSAEAAGWFWMTRKLNKWADADDIKGVTLRVNGGYNGLQERIAYLKRAKESLKSS
jgi:predicted chitinase